jgi:hypothetical protein
MLTVTFDQNPAMSEALRDKKPGDKRRSDQHGLLTLSDAREKLEPMLDDDLLNILANISATLNKAKSLLMV